MVLDQPEAQVGQGDEPAEVILRHDLRGVRVPGVVRHVIDGRVSHEVLHGVAVEGLVEELVWALYGGQEVQSEWRSGRVVAVDDVLHKVGGPGLPLKVRKRLALGCGVFDGLDEERVEVIAAGDLFLDAEDGGLELLYQNILLDEVEDMLLRIGVWCGGHASIFEDRAPVAVAKSVPSLTATTRAFCAGTRSDSSTQGR